MKISKTFLVQFLGLILIMNITSGCGSAIGTLMDLGANEQLKSKTVREETRNYEAVKAALKKNSLKVGMTKAEITRRYGQPVLSYPEQNRTTRLVYKATASDWLKGEKIYLFFDSNDTFISAQCINCPN